MTADDFGIVFRRAFSVYLAPEEADALVAMFAGETAVRVTTAANWASPSLEENPC